MKKINLRHPLSSKRALRLCEKDRSIRISRTIEDFEIVGYSNQPEEFSPLSEDEIPAFDEYYFVDYHLDKLTTCQPHLAIKTVEKIASGFSVEQARFFYSYLLENLISISMTKASAKLLTIIELVKANINNQEFNFQLNQFPVWKGTLAEFIEFISVALCLDKFGGMGMYESMETLMRVFKVKTVSNKPINGQRLRKLFNRKKSPHPLIDNYIAFILNKNEVKKTKEEEAKRIKREKAGKLNGFTKPL